MKLIVEINNIIKIMKEYIYLCGPTVYHKVHIGNMRPIVTFDLIVRGLKYLNPDTIFIHNITDIDDKIVQQALKEEKDELEISQKYYQFYLEMLKAYNVETIDYLPKVSDHIDHIVNFIEQIKQKKYAYEINHSVYFDTTKFSDYGKISHNNLDYLQSQKDELEQKNQFDFALWKNKTEGKVWKTSLGSGRPGWHTECAVFIDHYTKGSTLKIHGGGIDLKFPHHENESAQYEVVHQRPIAQKWLHVGVVNFQKQKMSKSLQNVILADQFLEKYHSDHYRLLILSTSIQGTIEIDQQTMQPIEKKLHQIEKIIHYLLLNDIDISKRSKVLDDEIAQLLASSAFAQINKRLNYEIKRFNELKDEHNATNVYMIISFLGFIVAQKEISQEMKKVYRLYQEALKKKDYITSDHWRKILMDEKLI